MNQNNSNEQQNDNLETENKEMSNFERSIYLIERNLQEITPQDKINLRKIVMERPLVIYWGTAITNPLHVAYLIPMMKIRDFLLAGCEVKILFADIHGFLDNLKATPEQVKKRYLYYEKIIKTVLSQVVDLEKANLKFIRGSEFQLSNEYSYDLLKLSTLTSIRDLKRAGADVVKQSENPMISSLIYPNMQALDEEYLKVDAQFGGVDQRKIFMHAKTFLPKIGYKKRLHLMNPMMPGLNSEKMSSSEDSSKIDFLDSDKIIIKKINKIFCEEANIVTNGILTVFKYLLFKFFEGRKILGCETYSDLEKSFSEMKIHPKDLKIECSKLLIEIVKPIREEMLTCPELVKDAYNRK
ncbi:SYYC [Hepatospora eriocheir]|uniref:Tyrosine--tRNA ligase n=1 Tax=Hepatospora eriocheir TaxID=1081669 RepID=A0A1X0QDB2_9MICR|nr:SYYC [Hepatospora eriocheir]